MDKNFQVQEFQKNFEKDLVVSISHLQNIIKNYQSKEYCNPLLRVVLVNLEKDLLTDHFRMMHEDQNNNPESDGDVDLEMRDFSENGKKMLLN